MTRTTVDIDASVLRELRKRQERERKTLGQLISELLVKALADEAGGNEPSPLRWTSRPLGLKVDLEDKEAVWAILDGR